MRAATLFQGEQNVHAVQDGPSIDDEAVRELAGAAQATGIRATEERVPAVQHYEVGAVGRREEGLADI